MDTKQDNADLPAPTAERPVWQTPTFVELRVRSGTGAKGSQVTEGSTTRNTAS